MPAGVVLDTSFLITLADPARAHHETARRYWRHFAEQGLPIFLPTIVVSEFCIRQEIPPEILRACVVLPFNWDDAMQAATLDFSKADREGQSRDALKDDVKIIAQAMVKDAAWIITDDKDTLYKFARELTTAGKATFRAIKLEDGFELAFFDPNGQRQLGFVDEAEDSDLTED
jgi:predicted nucleic acid-binding protein